MICEHDALQQQAAVVEDGLCPICLRDELQSLQLKASVRPGQVKRLKQEIVVLYRVIEKLGGK